MRRARVTAARRRALRAAFALLLGLTPLAQAGGADEANGLSRREWDAIKAVISDQLDALRRGDGPNAFAHATPALQRQFGDARGFMRMVREGYGALLEARYTEFLEGAVVDGVTIQPLRLVLPDNAVLVALYSMQRDGATWRIAGCVLAPSTVKAA
jgi:hypothetical protein